MAQEKRTTEPHDRLTGLCDRMISVLDHDFDASGNEKCIIFIEDEKRSGIVLHGYEDDTEAMIDLLIHLKSIFKANGKEMLIMPLNEG